MKLRRSQQLVRAARLTTKALTGLPVSVASKKRSKFWDNQTAYYRKHGRSAAARILKLARKYNPGETRREMGKHL